MGDEAKACIIDLDNCISDDQWRLEKINNDANTSHEKFLAYHLLCDHDEPHRGNLRKVFDLRAKHERLYVCTARPEIVRKQTEAWLRLHNVHHDGVLMRRDDDNRHSVEIKKEMAMKIRDQFGCFINCAIDDRTEILNMYRMILIPNVRKVQVYCPTIYDRTVR